MITLDYFFVLFNIAFGLQRVILSSRSEVISVFRADEESSSSLYSLISDLSEASSQVLGTIPMLKILD
jgi:hypothetical protein